MSESWVPQRCSSQCRRTLVVRPERRSCRLGSIDPEAPGPSARATERAQWSNATVNGSTDVVAVETALRNVSVPYRQLTAGSMVLKDDVSVRNRAAGWFSLAVLVLVCAAALPIELQLAVVVVAAAMSVRGLVELRAAVVVDLVGVRVRNSVRWKRFAWADIETASVATRWRGLTQRVRLVLRSGTTVELRALSHTWLSLQPSLGPEFAAVLDEERASANARRILRWSRP